MIIILETEYILQEIYFGWEHSRIPRVSSADSNFRDRSCICWFKSSRAIELVDSFSSKNSLSFSAVNKGRQPLQLWSLSAILKVQELKVKPTILNLSSQVL